MDLKNIIRKILLEQVSIPIYKEANPYKKIYANLKKVYYNTPDYILKEFFNTQILTNREALNAIIYKYKNNPLPVIDDFYDSFLKGPWKLKVLNVNPNDFDDPTVQAFIDREFGDVNAYLVPDDEERMKIQNKINNPCVKTKIKCVNDNLIFSSIREAARHYNIDNSCVAKHLKGRYDSVKGLRFVPMQL